MSKTDRTRPGDIQEKDPLNRQFRMCGNEGDENWFWKKMHPATQCWCCSGRYWRREKRARRSGWKREVRHELGNQA